MLTQEQIKKLKPGDPLIVHGKFEGIDRDGDIIIEAKTTDLFSDEVLTESIYAHPSCVSMPPEKPIEMFHTTEIPETYPKYDPCRKFRKGDIVEPRELYGRKHKALNYNYKYEVLEDEDKDGIVKVEYFDGGFTCTSYIPFYWFKLVTPVEELEPYFIEETEYEYCVSIMVGERKDIPATYHKRMHPHAKRAAEAECASLNAEHRKEQSNG